MTLKPYRSRFLKFVAALYMGFPVFYLCMAAVIFDIPIKSLWVILVSPFFIFLTAWSVATGYGFWEMRRWSWYIFLFTNSLIAFENASILMRFAETHHKILSFVFFLVLQILLIFRIGREIRVPYFLPKIRWWESNTRYQLSVPVDIRVAGREPRNGLILDLSIGGCYVKIRDLFKDSQKVSVEFRVFGQPIQIAGTVVWHSKGSVTHPEGVGIKFHDVTSDQKRSLRVALKRIKQVSAFYRKMPDAVDQEYLAQAFEEEPGDDIFEQTQSQLLRKSGKKSEGSDER